MVSVCTVPARGGRSCEHFGGYKTINRIPLPLGLISYFQKYHRSRHHLSRRSPSPNGLKYCTLSLAVLPTCKLINLRHVWKLPVTWC